MDLKESMAQIKALLPMVTQGPWILKRNRVTVAIISDITGDYITENVRSQLSQQVNAEFIVTARNAMPAMLEELERLQKALTFARAAEIDWKMAADALEAELARYRQLDADLGELKEGERG